MKLKCLMYEPNDYAKLYGKTCLGCRFYQWNWRANRNECWHKDIFEKETK